MILGANSIFADVWGGLLAPECDNNLYKSKPNATIYLFKCIRLMRVAYI